MKPSAFLDRLHENPFSAESWMGDEMGDERLELNLENFYVFSSYRLALTVKSAMILFLIACCEHSLG